MKRLFLFDLDGTLVSTGGAGMRALAKAFADLFGVPDAMKNLDPSGKTDPAIFREMIRLNLNRDAQPGDLERLGAAYLAHLEREMAVPGGKGALKGVKEFLSHLARRADVILALGTGNLERGARLKLAPDDLNEFFPIGGFGSDAEDRADVLRFGHRRAEGISGARIPADDVFVIGDTPLDVAAARRAVFRAVAVATGRWEMEALAQTSPDFAMPDMTHGFSWLETITSAKSAA
jgi:phosphoglycolate phosphatase